MVLGVCGFGYSGSGAVLDWLKDYPEVLVSDKIEFSFLYKPDGIGDLGNAVCYQPVRYFSSDSAIRRFAQYMKRIRKSYNQITNGKFELLIDKYLNNVIQIKWKGSTSVHSYQSSTLDYIFRDRIPRKILTLLNHHLNVVFHGSHWPEKEMFFSVLNENDFLKYTKELVANLIESLDGNKQKDIIVLNQCFCANNPEMSFRYFEDPLAITVTRDPRDTYLLAKRALGYETSFIPKSNIADFIIYYRGLMESRKYRQNNEKVIEVKFEDLIYKPEATFNYLEKIIGLSHIDVKEFKHFKPEVSINNTQLWLKYPQYKKDIASIEKELGEYLYPFDEFTLNPDFLSRTF